MLSSIATSLLLASVATTVVARPPQAVLTSSDHSLTRREEPENSCCFTLEAYDVPSETFFGPVRVSTIGEIRVGGSFPQAYLCLDDTTQTIQDGRGLNCFIDKNTKKFQCFRGLTGSNVFDLQTLPRPPSAPPVVALTVDGTGFFLLCPAESSDPHNPSANVFSTFESDGEVPPDCSVVSLLSGQIPSACNVDSDTDVDMSLNKNASINRKSSDQDLDDFKDFPICHLSSGPALSTSDSRFSGHFGLDVIIDKDGLVGAGSSAMNLEFDFNIPSSFGSSSAPEHQRCALLFQVPDCAGLPDGVPCIELWPTVEQYLPGFEFELQLINDTHLPTDWAGRVINRITPGQATILGHFRCGDEEPRKMSWQVTSARGGVFKLPPHADIEDAAAKSWEISVEMKDGALHVPEGQIQGLGFFVVACDQLDDEGDQD